MQLQDILVCSASYRHWPSQVDYAAGLAAMRHARLSGVYVRRPLDSFALSDNADLRAMLNADRERELAEATRMAGSFSSYCRARGLHDAAWLVAEGDPARVLAVLGGWHDMLVLSLGEHSGPRGYEPLELILLESRMPCLLLPEAVEPWSRPIEQIVIGWNGSIEAMRSVRSALPLLTAAKQVVLLRGQARDYGITLPRPPAVSIEGFLARHGVLNVEQHALVTDDHTIGEDLMAAAERFGADLLVMGAYGHPRLSEWLLGGATRHVLRHSTIPLFMQH
jgi:nucleotide-binding universal stress UspA family protein